jgi:hypothetical protein
MVHDLSQDTAAPAAGKSTDARPRQAVAGLMPPELAEATIRECFPSVIARGRPLCKAAAACMRTIVLAPLGWFLLALLFPWRIAPVFERRYTLTNRRLMVRKGWSGRPGHEVKLDAIDDVRLVEGSLDPFYRAGDLEVLSGGHPVLTLHGVPDPESFRQAVLNAVRAWVPGKAKGPFLPASAVKV